MNKKYTLKNVHLKLSQHYEAVFNPHRAEWELKASQPVPNQGLGSTLPMQSIINKQDEQPDEGKVLAQIREVEKKRQDAQQKVDQMDRKIRTVQEQLKEQTKMEQEMVNGWAKEKARRLRLDKEIKIYKKLQSQ